MNSDYKVLMLGLGYIGLPTAALIASKEIKVFGVDINDKVVETINRGRIHIVEPDLDGLVRNVVDSGNLKAGTSPISSDVYLIAVPTPFKEGYEPDISYVQAAVEKIIDLLKEGCMVIIESTSPVGTTEEMQKLILSKRPELIGKFYMAYCPERVLPGNVIYELQNNDRVIGGIDEKSTERAISFYKKFVKGQLHPTNARTAEMCKLVENSYRDVNIAFANELSIISDEADIDVWELINLANRHPRVSILQPGPGVGGHCIAVDPWFIVSKYGQKAKIIRSAREINDYKTDWVIEKIKNAALQFEIDNKAKPKVACLGLAFKPNIDDLRESPALHIVQALVKEGYDIWPVEPNITEHNQLQLYPYKEAIKKADIVVYLVKHDEFVTNKVDRSKQVIDFCGIV